MSFSTPLRHILFRKADSLGRIFNKMQTRSLSKFHKKIVRAPVRVYQPGEHVPQPGDPRSVDKMALPSSVNRKQEALKNLYKDKVVSSDDTTPSGILFNSVMGEILMTKGKTLLALEGTRLIVEALTAGLKLEKLFIFKTSTGIPSAIKKFFETSASADENIENAVGKDLKKSQELSSVQVHGVSQNSMKNWSTLTTPPGVIGIFKKQSLEEQSKNRSAVPVTVICDNIREPGNLGAVLRAAAGAGCRRVLVSKGCTDAWDGKVLRAGSGAHFYMPITTDVLINNIDSHIYAESPREDPLKEVSSADSQLATSQIVNKIEDANKERFPMGIFLADSNTHDSRSAIPIRSYTEVNYNKYEHIYLIVGGETEGLSSDSLQIAKNLSRSKKPAIEIQRLQIPMHCKMESLNVAHAFAVIVFEILRQRQSIS